MSNVQSRRRRNWGWLLALSAVLLFAPLPRAAWAEGDIPVERSEIYLHLSFDRGGVPDIADFHAPPPAAARLGPGLFGKALFLPAGSQPFRCPIEPARFPHEQGTLTLWFQANWPKSDRLLSFGKAGAWDQGYYREPSLRPWKDVGLYPELLYARSHDDGRTWTEAEYVGARGVLPGLIRLSNGVLAASYGRPDVCVMFSLDGEGENWTNHTDLFNAYRRTSGPTPPTGGAASIRRSSSSPRAT